ncbi:hypothetical protein [Rosistilla oblonga]|uniref:hypothetical protein n=1 Tax=Rosistilla oblonga TaxID=2527990 RepID=UPI003A974A0A
MNERTEAWIDDCRQSLQSLFVDEAARIFVSLEPEDVDTFCSWLFDLCEGELGDCGRWLFPSLHDLGGWVVDGLDSDDCFSVGEAAIGVCGGLP